MRYVKGATHSRASIPDLSQVVMKARTELPDHEAFLSLVERAAEARKLS
jgi:hypothetical protein